VGFLPPYKKGTAEGITTQPESESNRSRSRLIPRYSICMATSLLRDLKDYTAALLRQGAALVVGAAFSIALAVVPALQGKEAPPWLWALALAIAPLPAAFLAWRDERGAYQKLEALIPPGGLDFNLPKNMKPTGHYAFMVQKEERKELERLRVEVVELRKRIEPGAR
jgi:hypothetical protein